MKPALTIAALTAAALAPAGAAEAAGIKTAKFVAYVEGKQVTEWNIPRYGVGSDCQGQRYLEGQGKETIRFRTKPARVLAYKPSTATVPQLKIGTWSLLKVPKTYALGGSGTIVRTGKRIHSLDPGQCHDAGDPTSWDTGPYDCGTRRFTPSVTLGWQGNRVKVSAVDLVDAVADFGNCPVEGPVEPDEGGFTDISQRYPVRDLFDPSQGLVVVLGRKSWTESIARDHGTATTLTTFTIRLRRAR